jgi:hypothetical protein
MKHILPIIALGTLTACATLTADSDQKISVTTEPAGASCTLTNADGSWNIAKTPGSANVKRSFSPLTIQCKKSSASASQVLEPATRNRAYGNILLGGVPALVDAHTGDGYEYAPSEINLKLK